MMGTQEVLSARGTDGVLQLTLRRPPLNVLTIDMMKELTAAVREAPAAGAKVILLTGDGARAFCAGVDVADHTPERVGAMISAFHGLIDALLHSDVPVVAALNGAALGGGMELALASDIVLAREGAVLGQPEIRLGVFPPAAAALLPRLIGRQSALDLILTGRTLTATEALALGLVTRVLPPGDFIAGALAYAATLTAHSAAVQRLARRAVLNGLDLPLRDAMAQADRIYLDELMLLNDAHEGLAAFLEKRQPAWSHQ
jgi:cyclohexa-1,5-dienecarbonyl-CoA hydratase